MGLRSVRKEMLETLLTVFLIWQRKEGHTVAPGPEPALLTHCLFCFLMGSKGHIVCPSKPNVAHIVNKGLCLNLSFNTRKAETMSFLKIIYALTL